MKYQKKSFFKPNLYRNSSIESGWKNNPNLHFYKLNFDQFCFFKTFYDISKFCLPMITKTFFQTSEDISRYKKMLFAQCPPPHKFSYLDLYCAERRFSATRISCKYFHMRTILEFWLSNDQKKLLGSRINQCQQQTWNFLVDELVFNWYCFRL